MTYENDAKTVPLIFGDGKADIVGLAFREDVIGGLDCAREEGAATVILCGKKGMVSGGYDLKAFAKGAEQGLHQS
tara:strand:+ start:3096 stop:3320 length:225 start_codon:yes stop_codon:yes gene_type:complete